MKQSKQSILIHSIHLPFLGVQQSSVIFRQPSYIVPVDDIDASTCTGVQIRTRSVYHSINLTKSTGVKYRTSVGLHYVQCDLCTCALVEKSMSQCTLFTMQLSCVLS